MDQIREAILSGDRSIERYAGIAVPEVLAAIVAADPPAEPAPATALVPVAATPPAGRRARRPARAVGADEAVV